ncbi:MAG TPA: GtrA family protein [Sedimentibacter sp.]|jgi:putative flippase GtrA|nr:GtrA family protein [Sedimentibacter sp.]NLA13968.1 GtrA family protein [Tissierellia bacterium]HAS91541.1 teichoic acid glycosylation protein [Clostridiales bacterium]HOA19231.1 GtrA family protein [Sedimentibacter sp.]HOG62269.1 GtrA family protein [Sedimentibacter sp.]
MKNGISKELAAYLIAGILTTIVNFIVYYAMLFIGIDYKISNTAAFIISVIFAFIINKKYVFLSDKSYFKEFIKFSLGRLFTYALDIGAMIILIEVFSVSEYMAKLWTNILVMISNYLISKFWTFK